MNTIAQPFSTVKSSSYADLLNAFFFGMFILINMPGLGAITLGFLVRLDLNDLRILREFLYSLKVLQLVLLHSEGV